MSNSPLSTSSSPPPPASCFGTSLSSYHIPHPTHPLGRGSFSTVHYALSLPSKYPVALKLIPRTFLSRPKLKRRILTEIRLHLTLCHDCIVGLYRVFVSEKYIVLVLELCKGGSLARLIKKKKRQLISSPSPSSIPSSSMPSPILPLSAVREILIQLINGLEYLHSHGIIHRDLKLGNIFLSSRPRRDQSIPYRLKIGDFGLSHRLLSATERRRTQLGTPNYIAPEILQSIPHGKQVDLWSLGCIIYALVKGVPPFHSSTVKGTLRRVKKFGVCSGGGMRSGGNGDNVSLDLDLDGLGDGLGEIVRGLLCGDQERRWGLDAVKSHWWIKGERRDQRNQREKERSSSCSRGGERGLGTGTGGRFRVQQRRPRPRPRRLPEEEIRQRHVTPTSRRLNKDDRITTTTTDSQDTRHDTDKDEFANFKLVNTERIEPYVHQTKHGSVEILTDGRVVVRHRSTRFVIARSGNRMAILSTSSSRCRPIVLVVPPPPGDRVQRDLFLKYRAFYEFGRLFVEVLRSKTPKVEFFRHTRESTTATAGSGPETSSEMGKESGMIRCALMENGPRADFEVVWCSSGLGLAYSRKEERVSIRRARKKMDGPVNSLRWSGEPCATVLVRDRVVAFPASANGRQRRKSLSAMPELHPFLRTMMRLLKVCESAERRAEREGLKFPLMIRDVNDVSRDTSASSARPFRGKIETIVQQTSERERREPESFPRENFKRAAAVASSSSCSESSSEYSPRLSVSSTLSSARLSRSPSSSSSPTTSSRSAESHVKAKSREPCAYRCCAKRFAVEEFSRVSLAGLDQDDDEDGPADVRRHEMRTCAVKKKDTAAGWDMLFW